MHEWVQSRTRRSPIRADSVYLRLTLCPDLISRCYESHFVQIVLRNLARPVHLHNNVPAAIYQVLDAHHGSRVLEMRDYELIYMYLADGTCCTICGAQNTNRLLLLGSWASIAAVTYCSKSESS